MVPTIVLNPLPGEKVLDLTAAPGSKTTELAALMNNEGYILANELDKIRCERLKYNVEKQGAEIIEVINGRGEKIGDNYPEIFDKVLLDTPCSGEGRFIVDKLATYRDWSQKTVRELSKLQKKLITSAYKALKNLNLKLLDIDIEIKNTEYADNENLDKSINKAIRILPSKQTEGFFVAKLVKLEEK